jgi:flagellar biosynthesis/type III secretory pathway protein FliH
MILAASADKRKKPQVATCAVVEALVYPVFPAPQESAWLDMETILVDSDSAVPPPQQTEDAQVQFEQRIAEESHRSFESGREHGRLEGIQAERDTQAAMKSAAESQLTDKIAVLIQKFDEARDRYLRAVEHEVVELALAIAARVLRREAQMDPLLLTGAVRVALGQLATTAKVRLHVPAAECDMWTEAIEHLPNLALRPTVHPDDGMRVGDCVIETELGSVDLGIRSQLGEIERGFFDRTDRRQISDTPTHARTSSREAQP